MPRKNIKYTKQLLEQHAEKVKSFSALLRSLGLRDVGGNFRHIQRRCRYFNVDTSHFTGQGWSRGATAADNEIVAQIAKKLSLSSEEIFAENSRANLSNPRYRQMAIEQGVSYVCEKCNNDGVWMQRKLTLHLDHRNGISNDNRICNLRFLCPNCHQQTPTWGHRRKR